MRAITRLCAVSLVCCLAACGGDTAPQTLDLSITPNGLAGPAGSLNDQGQLQYGCSAYYLIEAHGPGTATFVDGWLRFAYAKGSQPTDSVVLTAASLQQIWGTPQITEGQSRTIQIQAFSTQPFTATFVLHYQTDPVRLTKTYTHSFDCRPPADSASITKLSVALPPGDLQPGQIIPVEYAVRNPAGFRGAVLHFSPCQDSVLIAGNGDTTVSTTTSVAIPARCELGRDVVMVMTTSGGGWHSLDLHRVLIDTTPPHLDVMFIGPSGGGLFGDYFAGDSLELQFAASDNNMLASIDWQFIPGGADSLVSPWVAGIARMQIPLVAADAGTPVFKAFARDAAGNVSNVISSIPDSIRVHPLIATSESDIALNDRTSDFVIDDKRGLLYVMDAAQGKLLVVSLATMAVTQTVTSDVQLGGMDITPSGDSLVVVLNGERALAIFDLRQAVLHASILPLTALDTTLAQYPSGSIRVAANNKVFMDLRANTLSGDGMAEVDLTTGAQRLRPEAGSGGVVNVPIIRSGDHRVLAINTDACFQIYHADTDQFGACTTTVGRQGGATSLDATGAHIAVGLDVYDGSLHFVHAMRTTTPIGMPETVISPDGSTVYELMTGPGVVATSTTDGSITGWLRNSLPLPLVHFSADGKTMVLAASDNATSTIRVLHFR